MTFDLNKRVEQLLDDSDLSEPHEVADKVIAGLSRTERPVAFREAMTAYSRHAGVDPSSDTGQEGFDAQSRRAGVAPKRKRGEQHNWNDTARSRARLIAESCIKQAHSPYRAVYDTGRAKYAECDITDLHKHNRALRLVAKAVLRDMWIESRRATA